MRYSSPKIKRLRLDELRRDLNATGYRQARSAFGHWCTDEYPALCRLAACGLALELAVKASPHNPETRAVWRAWHDAEYAELARCLREGIELYERSRRARARALPIYNEISQLTGEATIFVELPSFDEMMARCQAAMDTRMARRLTGLRDSIGAHAKPENERQPPRGR